MTGPKPPGKRKRQLTEDEELELEAYGPKGAALRKGLATLASKPAKATSDSSASQKLGARVKSFLKRTQGR